MVLANEYVPEECDGIVEFFEGAFEKMLILSYLAISANNFMALINFSNLLFTFLLQKPLIWLFF